MTTVANNAVTTAVLDTLATAAEAGAWLVGDAEKPAGGGWQGEPGTSVFVPYVVLWPIPGGYIDGSLGRPDSDAESLYQATSVGATRQQAETVGDRVRAALVGAQLTIPGRGLIRVRCEELGGATPDRSVEPAVFMVPDQFVVCTDS
jgi:hypothetical protein